MNRAIAVAEIDGPDACLAILDRLDLGHYRYFHSTRADFLRRAGRPDEARFAYRRALDLAQTEAEQRLRLAPLLAGIQDPFLHATSQLALAWTLPITGDFDGALWEVTVALDELRGQDETVFTAMAAFTAGSLNSVLGRYDDALRDMREARDLAEQAGGDWLGAGSGTQLGILAVLRGRPDEARDLLDEALDRSLAARSTTFVALCLAAYAQLAFAEGDPERAALLEGAAERACGGGPACGCGRRCARTRTSSWPRSARRWARSGTIRRSPPGPGSPSGRR